MKHSSGTAIITGGSSGIGAEFAKQLALQGYHLILIGNNKDELREFSEKLTSEYHASVEYSIADLTDTKQIQIIEEKIKQINDIKIVINCAGFGLHKDFLDERIENREKMITIHDITSIRLTYEAIKVMKKNKEGIIINVSSLAAIIPLGGNPIYAASKAFVHSFSQNLYRAYKKDNIYIQSLCPGFTATNFYQKAGRKTHPKRMMSAQKVAKISLKYARRKKPVCIPGLRNKLFFAFYFILPKRISRIIFRRFAK